MVISLAFWKDKGVVGGRLAWSLYQSTKQAVSWTLLKSANALIMQTTGSTMLSVRSTKKKTKKLYRDSQNIKVISP